MRSSGIFRRLFEVVYHYNCKTSSFVTGFSLSMTIEHAQLESRYFDLLNLKYCIDRRQSVTSPGFLYFILRRANLGYLLTESEKAWLKQRHLFDTLETIELEAQLRAYQTQEEIQMEAEFEQLQAKYQPFLTRSLSRHVHPILWKIDHHQLLDDLETQFLQNNLFEDLLQLAQKIQGFALLKQKYGAANHSEFLPDGQLVIILQRLQENESLSDTEILWLLDENLSDTLAIYKAQEQEKQIEAALVQLKAKYQVSDHPDCSVGSRLHSILQKLEAETPLDSAAITWLKTQPQVEHLLHLHQKLAEQHRFAKLKQNYHATHSSEQSTQSKLYKVLKAIDASQIIDGATVDWLEKQGLPETARIACDPHFQQLRRKYRIINPAFIPFYQIMLRLERKERLERVQVAQLIDEKQLLRDGEIAKAHHRLEAEFYEQEYRHTGNKWKIVTAMSDWRKANEFERALSLTQNLKLKAISDNKLKAALLTNRGFTLKDCSSLSEARTCAEQAIEFNPRAFQPYLLMAILSYKSCDFNNGDQWMQQAVSRGAEPGDLDYEMKRLVKNTKETEERQKLIHYLLEIDSQRYAWAKAYQKSKV